MGIIKRIIKKCFFNNNQTKSTTEEVFFNKAYSQEGEDILLSRIFEGKKDGFYLDIGAHHPKRFSNTYLFYQKGWRGINIDPIPGIMKKFEVERPEDINLEIAIGEKEIELNYFNFKEKALNTFSEELANQYQNEDWELENIIKVKTYPLDKILNQYLPINTTIDFISIDVEGLDLQVLISNNWLKYRPLIVLVESLEMVSINEFQKSEVYIFLISKGYLFFAKTVNTCFFKISN